MSRDLLTAYALYSYQLEYKARDVDCELVEGKILHPTCDICIEPNVTSHDFTIPSGNLT